MKLGGFRESMADFVDFGNPADSRSPKYWNPRIAKLE